MICGFPAVDARELMRELSGRGLSDGRLALAAAATDPAALVERLKDEGLIEPAEPGVAMWHTEAADGVPGVRYWTASLSKSALAKARIGKPMPRAKAVGARNFVVPGHAAFRVRGRCRRIGVIDVERSRRPGT